MRYAQVVSAYPDRGLCVAWQDGAVIRRRRLQVREDPRGDSFTDWVAVRVEAERVAGRLVVIPRLGELVPS